MFPGRISYTHHLLTLFFRACFLGHKLPFYAKSFLLTLDTAELILPAVHIHICLVYGPLLLTRFLPRLAAVRVLPRSAGGRLGKTQKADKSINILRPFTLSLHPGKDFLYTLRRLEQIRQNTFRPDERNLFSIIIINIDNQQFFT